MSRVNKYRESLLRFIKDRSNLKSYIPNEEMLENVLTDISLSSMLPSILLLTTMNSQTKKRKISVQGYYASASVEFLNQMVLKHRNVNPYLLMASTYAFFQNVESIKNFIDDKSCFTISLNLTNIYTSSCRPELIQGPPSVGSGKKPSPEAVKWWYKDNPEFLAKFKQIKQLDRTAYDDYVSLTYGSMAEIAMCSGWLLGGGDVKGLSKIRKISRYFSMIYKLMVDFTRVEDDVNECQEYCSNYVVNYGLQESYEMFMYNKQKFIEECLILDIYTYTIKEIVGYIDEKVEGVIDQTSPDLKSTCSSI